MSAQDTSATAGGGDANERSSSTSFVHKQPKAVVHRSNFICMSDEGRCGDASSLGDSKPITATITAYHHTRIITVSSNVHANKCIPDVRAIASDGALSELDKGESAVRSVVV